MSRRLTALVTATCLVTTACGAEIAEYDPVVAPYEQGEVGGPLVPATVPEPLESESEGEGLRRREPGFPIADFDPLAPILPQLPRRDGFVVEVLGPEIDSAAESLNAAFDVFTEATGIAVEYTGSADADVLLDELIEAGDAPDIVMIPQPGRIEALARRGELVPMPQLIKEEVTAGFDSFWTELATVEERVYAVPQSANLKSLVWYQPQVFARNGYAIPTSLDELDALVNQIRRDGGTPWCIGISSGEASGWPFTDWVEDYMLRLKGPDFYDRWVNHEIPFNDPEVVEVIDHVGAIWFRRGNVFGGRDGIDSTTWADAARAHLSGECVLHRQASFIAGTYRDAEARIGPNGDVDAFYLPTDGDRFGRVVLGAGTFAAALDGSQWTLALMAYIASPDFANERVRSGQGGYLSANRLHDTSLYPDPIDRTFADILVSADPFRFDGSDLMPADIGSNVFWRTGTVYVGGTIDTLDLVDEIEALWPR